MTSPAACSVCEVKRTELRKQHPDRLRRTILDILERVVSDRDDIRRAARRAARIKWRSKFDAVWGGGNPRVYDSVRLIGGRYYPRCAIAVPAAWLLARLTRAEIVTAIRKKREQLKEDAEQQTRRQAKIRACAPAPDAPDTLGWRGWRFDGQVLISPMQGTRWCDATMRAELWSDGDAVRGFSGIHARRLPR